MISGRQFNWLLIVFLSLLGISFGGVLDSIFPSSISPFIAPRPNDLFQELMKQPWIWIRAIVWTAAMSVIAAIASTFFGTLIGFSAAFFRLWALDRWGQLIWSIPLIASSTYLLLAFGHGWLYGLALGVFLGFYPIERHVYSYCSMRSEGVNSLSASFALSRWREFLYIRLLGSLRGLGSALSQTIPLCFIGQTMGEFTSAKISPFSIGLGGLLRFAQNYSNYSQLWLSIIFMMVLVFFSGEIIKMIWGKLFPQSYDGGMIQ